jgi:hypothetical protein
MRVAPSYGFISRSVGVAGREEEGKVESGNTPGRRFSKGRCSRFSDYKCILALFHETLHIFCRAISLLPLRASTTHFGGV